MGAFIDSFVRPRQHPRLSAGFLAVAVGAAGGCGVVTPTADGATREPSGRSSSEPATKTNPTPASSTGPTTTAGPAPHCPAAVPTQLGLDQFYDQHCDVLGIPLVADEVVDPHALRLGAEIMREMLAHRPDVADALAEGPVRVGVIGRDQETTDMPEWSDLDEAFPGTDWDVRTRGVGATVERPLVGGGEENLLCLPQDRYLGESIFLHELSHTVLQLGVEARDPQFRSRLVRAYDEARADGRWEGTYAATNPDEYWAEAVQSYFDANLENHSQHNEVNTRAELERYDPALFALVAEVFGPGDWRPACP